MYILIWQYLYSRLHLSDLFFLCSGYVLFDLWLIPHPCEIVLQFDLWKNKIETENNNAPDKDIVKLSIQNDMPCCDVFN
jgi:hypothetical protein